MCTKICSKCNIEKDVSEYKIYYQKPRKDGTRRKSLRASCKNCDSEMTRNWFKKNPEYKKQWRKDNPDKMKQEYEKRKDKVKKWVDENREKHNKTKREYKEKHKEKFRVKELERSKIEREQLSDYYIASLIAKRNNLSATDVRKNKCLLEAKRISLQITRHIKDL